MNRCMVLAAVLYDPFRTPPDVVVQADGSFTESQQVTAAQIARARRDPAVAALWDRFRRPPAVTSHVRIDTASRS